MEKIFSLSDFQVDTFDSYFNSPILNRDFLVIPYINVGVMNHPLNPEKKLKYIDRAYIVLKNITFLKINNAEIKINIDRELPSLYFGGENLDQSNGIIEIEVKAKEAFLQLLDDSKFSNELWLPQDTPRFKKNMEDEKVKSFLAGMNLPDDILEMIKE